MKIKFMLGENPTLSEIVNVLNKSKTYVITTVSEYNQKVYTNHILYEWDEDDND